MFQAAIALDRTSGADFKVHTGTESVTVPAGTFSCEHWVKDDGKGEAWVNAKIAPLSLVKSVDNGDTMVLVKVIGDAKTHLPEPR